MFVEAAHRRERASGAEVAVEIDDARHGELRLVIPSIPGQMRVAHQDGIAGRGSRRCKRPRVRARIRTETRADFLRSNMLLRTRCRVIRRRYAIAVAAFEQAKESSNTHRCCPADIASCYVVTCEVGHRPLRHFIGIRVDEVVDARSEAFHDGPNVLIDLRICLDGVCVTRPILYVTLDIVGTKMPCHLAPRRQQQAQNRFAIIFHLRIAEPESGSADVLGVDVRHAVVGTEDFHLLREHFSSRLRAQRQRERQENGEQGKRTSDAWQVHDGEGV